jgi:YD repeat-containing protein
LGYESTGGRLSTLTLPGGVTRTYSYGAGGALAAIVVSGTSLSYSYDGSLLTQTTWGGSVAGAVTGSVNRTYDNNFRISSQSINGANSVSFGYDNDSLLTAAGALTINRHAQHGLITGSTLGAVMDTRSYSPFGELSSYTANANGSAVYNATYTRDKLGRIAQKVETIGGQTDTYEYLYDPAGRLQEVKKNGGTFSTHTYDTNGNRLSVRTGRRRSRAPTMRRIASSPMAIWRLPIRPMENC